jgi:hypothetical protein
MAYIRAVHWGRLPRGALGHERNDREVRIGWQRPGAGPFTEALLRIGVEGGHLRGRVGDHRGEAGRDRRHAATLLGRDCQASGA